MSVTAHGLGAARNGMPGRKPYVYRGDPGEAEVQRKVARLRAQAARDLQTAPTEQPAAAPVPPKPPARTKPSRPAVDAPRCETCGYLETRCSCPGGPRG